MKSSAEFGTARSLLTGFIKTTDPRHPVTCPL
jgi:hypothetical protein